MINDKTDILFTIVAHVKYCLSDIDFNVFATLGTKLILKDGEITLRFII